MIQDRHSPQTRKSLLATHGRTIHWVIHVSPAIKACPVRPKSGYSAKARVYEYTPSSGAHAAHRAPEEDHERRRVSRRSQAGAETVPRSDTRPARRDPRAQGLGH